MNNKDNPDARGPADAQAPDGSKSAEKPQWADSLRNLYDSVVDEPIPDSFKDLLAQFDEPKAEQPPASQKGENGQ